MVTHREAGRRGMRILVVDDEDIVLDSCQVVLEDEGFEVLLVTSADKALEAIEKEDFALLLADIKMPDRNGIHLIGEVNKRRPRMPIIAMSGYPTPETIEEATKMGATTFIPKPFTPDELIAEVRQVLQK